MIKRLKLGDLVLTPHYFSGEKVPGRMVLARFDKRDGIYAFYSKSLVVLHKFNPGREIMPQVSQSYQGDVNVFEKGNFGTLHGWRVRINPPVADGEVYVGTKEVLEKLESTEGYVPHAAALRES